MASLTTDFEEETSREWMLWSQSLPTSHFGAPVYPAPDTPHGTPAGWRIVHVYPSALPDSTYYVCRRDAGGWALIRFESDLAHTLHLMGALSLGDLLALADRGQSAATRERVAGIRAALCELYDPVDPKEAVERALFALGGPLIHPPRRSL